MPRQGKEQQMFLFTCLPDPLQYLSERRKNNDEKISFSLMGALLMLRGTEREKEDTLKVLYFHPPHKGYFDEFHFN